LPTIYCRDKQFNEIQAVVFDKDGTLEDSHSFLRQFAIEVAHQLDREIDGLKDPLLKSFGVSGGRLDPNGLMAVGSRFENEIATATHIAQNGKDWVEARIIAHHAFERAEAIGRESTIFPGCYEVISKLYEAGLKLAVLSSARTQNILSFLEEHRLTHFISVIQGSDQGLSKPDPACFHLVCEKLSVRRENALMVGDSQMDIQMAKRAGAAGVVGICWGNPLSPTLVGADVAIGHLDQLQC
jgi:phosphoglycolate phosphatase